MQKAHPRPTSQLNDKVYLYDLYISKQLSSRKIAKIIGCSAYTINTYLRKHGIIIRKSNKDGVDLTGKKKFFLTAIRYTDEQAKDGQRIWMCKCDCGKETQIKTSEFGKIKSCGCLIKQIRQQHPNWRGYNDISMSMINKIYTSAKKRGLEYNLSPKYLWDLYLSLIHI